MTLRGRILNGAVVLDAPPPLPEGAEVEVVVRAPVPAGPKSAAGGAEPPTLFEQLKDCLGIAEGLPEDASRNLDHYLYGHPKK